MSETTKKSETRSSKTTEAAEDRAREAATQGVGFSDPEAPIQPDGATVEQARAGTAQAPGDVSRAGDARPDGVDEPGLHNPIDA